MVCIEHHAGGQHGEKDQRREDGQPRQHLGGEHLEIAHRHGLPEEHGVVPPVGAEGVGAVEEQRHQQVDEPERGAERQPELVELEGGRDAHLVGQAHLVEHQRRGDGEREDGEQAERGEEEGAAMLEVFALDEGNHGFH